MSYDIFEQADRRYISALSIELSSRAERTISFLKSLSGYGELELLNCVQFSSFSSRN